MNAQLVDYYRKALESSEAWLQRTLNDAIELPTLRNASYLLDAVQDVHLSRTTLKDMEAAATQAAVKGWKI